LFSSIVKNMKQVAKEEMHINQLFYK
jgi:hypothetical protein